VCISDIICIACVLKIKKTIFGPKFFFLMQFCICMDVSLLTVKNDYVNNEAQYRLVSFNSAGALK
jgi:hypothetical protein